MIQIGDVSMKAGTEGAVDADGPDPTSADRRRPGRAPRVPTSLLPLLRRDTLLTDGATALAAHTADGETADIRSGDSAAGATDSELDSSGERVFMGVLVGALMATPFWIFAGILIWWIAG